MILAVAERLLDARDAETLARVAIDAARDATGADSGHMTLIKESGRTHDLLCFRPGGGDGVGAAAALGLVRELWGDVCRSGDPVFDNDFSERGATHPEPVEIRNAMVAPVAYHGVALGAIGLTNKAGGFNENDCRAMEVLAGLAATVLQCLRAEEERRKLEARLVQVGRLSDMGVLAAGVAHEVNNPLSYVLFNLESLVEDVPQLLRFTSDLQALVADRLGHRALSDPELVEASRRLDPTRLSDIEYRLRDTLDGAQRIKEIARGIATFARVEVDQATPVQIGRVIDVAATIAHNEIKCRAQLLRDYGDTPTVVASEGRLAQVFLNLIINATQAIEDGDAKNNWIRVRTWADGREVYAEVRDSGAGIPPPHLAKLFDPFFTTKDVGVGAGLGLSISRSIIESYGGTIEVRSVVREGTSFVVRLPTEGTAVSPAVGARRMDFARISPQGRILVIDDEPGIRSSIAKVLSAHQLVLAASGREALSILEHDREFDLVLCDVMMPAVSGVDVHRWLVERDSRIAEAVVFISGGAFTQRARQYLARVKNPCLEKPIETEELRLLVRDRIDARTRHDAT